MLPANIHVQLINTRKHMLYGLSHSAPRYEELQSKNMRPTSMSVWLAACRASLEGSPRSAIPDHAN